MGIGNTASAALIMHRLAPAPLDHCVGAGAGQDEAGMARKRAAIARAAARSAATAPRDVLAEFGGCEIAMMAGAVLGAAAQRRPVLVDGFIASAAALAAIRLAPAARDYCVFAHQSAERGHARLLALDVTPLLDLGMRLGEGTGAVLAAPLLRAAARLLTDVADLSEVVPRRRAMSEVALFLPRGAVPDHRADAAEASFEPDWLPRSAKYFPLVGVLIGGLSGGRAARWRASCGAALVPALLAVSASVLLTGAFHEDGLADSADRLGGRTPERA